MQKEQNIFSQLPDEIKLHIASFFSVRELTVASMVSHSWKKYFLDHQTWQQHWQSYQKWLLSEYGLSLSNFTTPQPYEFLPNYYLLPRLQRLEKSDLKSFLKSFDPFSIENVACRYARLNRETLDLYESKMFFIIRLAAIADNTQLLTWLIQNNYLPFDNLIYACLVRTGNLSFIKWFASYKNSKKFIKISSNSYTLGVAAESGNFKLVQYLVDEQDFELDEHTLTCAVKSGNLLLVKWLMEVKQILPSYSTFRLATYSGNVRLIKWLIENKYFKPCNRELSDMARSRKGVYTLMTWLIESYHLKPSYLTLLNAAKAGNRFLVQWLIETNNSLFDQNQDNRNLLDAAIGSGNLALTKWLIEEKQLRTFDSEFIDSAERSGNFALIEWIKDFYHVTRPNIYYNTYY